MDTLPETNSQKRLNIDNLEDDPFLLGGPKGFWKFHHVFAKKVHHFCGEVVLFLLRYDCIWNMFHLLIYMS